MEIDREREREKGGGRERERERERERGDEVVLERKGDNLREWRMMEKN